MVAARVPCDLESFTVVFPITPWLERRGLKQMTRNGCGSNAPLNSTQLDSCPMTRSWHAPHAAVSPLPPTTVTPMADRVGVIPVGSADWAPMLQMFSKEQIYIQHSYTWELKQLEKEVLHFANAGYDIDYMDLLAICRDWFAWKDQERKDRIAREEAWRREWSGKKGAVKRLFDEIDADGSGAIDLQELETALGRRVFLDSDDLQDLTKLEAHVKDSKCVLLLQTRSVLERPWCLLELNAAGASSCPLPCSSSRSPAVSPALSHDLPTVQ